MTFISIKVNELPESNNRTCGVCLDEFKPEQSLLGHWYSKSVIHVFHYKCFLSWFEIAKKCPFCQLPANVKYSVSFISRFYMELKHSYKAAKKAAIVYWVVSSIFFFPKTTCVVGGLFVINEAFRRNTNQAIAFALLIFPSIGAIKFIPRTTAFVIGLYLGTSEKDMSGRIGNVAASILFEYGFAHLTGIRYAGCFAVAGLIAADFILPYIRTRYQN